METIKCVLVGDGNVGKTCLLQSHRYWRFVENTDKRFVQYGVTVRLYGKDTTLMLFDTDGQDEYKEFRQYSYINADLILLCFALNSFTSLQNIERCWYPEVDRFCKGVPKVLLGTKQDLRKPTVAHSYEVRTDQGIYAATQQNCIEYLECSATNPKELSRLFCYLVKTMVNLSKN